MREGAVALCFSMNLIPKSFPGKFTSYSYATVQNSYFYRTPTQYRWYRSYQFVLQFSRLSSTKALTYSLQARSLKSSLKRSRSPRIASSGRQRKQFKSSFPSFNISTKRMSSMQCFRNAMKERKQSSRKVLNRWLSGPSRTPTNSLVNLKGALSNPVF